MTAATALEDHLKWTCVLPEGWHGLYQRVAQVLAAEDPGAVIFQAKDKLGELRLYLENDNGMAPKIIRIATVASRQSCEQCGRLARLSRSDCGGYATVCERHAVDQSGRAFVPEDAKPMTSFALRDGQLVAAVTLEGQACSERPDLLAMFLPQDI